MYMILKTAPTMMNTVNMRVIVLRLMYLLYVSLMEAFPSSSSEDVVPAPDANGSIKVQTIILADKSKY